MDSEQRRAYNSKNCSANAHLEFRGAVIVDSKTREGKDYVCLDLVFNEGIKIRIFDPSKSQRDRSLISVMLSSLFQALGDDFGDIPPCRGGWHEFLTEVTRVLSRYKYTMLYAKVTVNESGYIIMGEGRCFSTKPDMEYTDSDLHFLTVDEVVKSSPKEGFMPEYEDISFETVVMSDSTEVIVSSSPDSVTEIWADSNEDTTDIVFDAVNEPVSDAVQEFLKDGPVYEMEVADTTELFVDFTEPSDLDDIFSKPPGKSQIDQVMDGVLAKVAEKLDGEIMEGRCDPEPYIMPSAKDTEEKPKKKPAKPRIPKGADPLRYIKGDPDEIEWGTRENKIIDLKDIPK